jgi:cell division septal protein FtsQ
MSMTNDKKSLMNSKKQTANESRSIVLHTSHRARRQARQKLRYRFQSRLLPAPRRLVLAKPGARAVSLWLLVTCAVLIYLFSTSDWFYVQAIVVQGNNAVPSDEIVKASGALNYSVFFLRFGELESKLRAMPSVKDAHVAYEFPNALTITVAERRPVFAWESNKKSWWADESGQLFAARSPLTNTLTVRDSDNLQRAQLSAQLVASVKAVMAALPTLKRLDYSDLKGLSFVDERDWRIMLGQPDQLNAKLAMLQTLSSYLVSQKIEAEYIDVRLPERAFYKPK